MLNVFSRGSLTSFNQVIRYSTVLLQFCCCCCSCYRHLTLLTLLEKQWCGWWCGQHRPVFTVYVVTFSVVCQLKGCIREVGHWVSANRLKLNTDKNELVWTGSRHNLRLLGGCSPSLQLGNDVIKPSDYVRLLGATIAADLGLDKHVSNVCKTCFFWLRQLRRVHCSLDIESVKMLVPAFVTSRVDNCHSVLSSVPKKIMDKLQHVQNAAAPLVTGTCKYVCGLSRLIHDDLHWLLFLSECSTSLLWQSFVVFSTELQRTSSITACQSPKFLVTSICDLPDVINCQFHEFTIALLRPVHFLSPGQQCGIHCLIICAIQLLTPTILGGTWRRICSPDIRSVSALEVLRNHAPNIYLLTYLLN